MGDASRRDLTSTDPCTLNPDPLAQQICNQLFDAFSECAGVIDPAPHLAMCVMDMCDTLVVGDDTGGCSIAATYASLCQESGVAISDWRSDSPCAIECPPNQVYNTCGSACPPTCDIPFPVAECTEQCIEGCFCEDGLILDVGNVCIPQSECGCYAMDTLYRFNEVLPNGETCSCEFANTVCSECHFYEVNTTSETWSNAKDICEEKGGRLAIINEASVFNLVRQFIFNNGYDDDVRYGFWFGLNDLVNESEFVWSDNTTLLDGDYTMWARDQPSGGIRPHGVQDCVQMWKRRAFKWDDANCETKKGYICEYTDGCF
uniref:IgGFc-binding protein-like n=1 Tax=Saccoglossus kowalevskii TaxID=10224 RepID=A0ABM0GRV3_SACKO|nr:PREDICTED: IgGFc-binding protein-like [Saccoglossus kowalevskii]